MDSSNEQTAILVAKVAELIDILLEFFGVDESDADMVTQSLEQYAQKVEDLAITAESSEYFGLYNVCMLFQVGVIQLAGAPDTVDDQARSLLEEWPTLVMAYLESPTNIEASAALITHLRNPKWSIPLSDEDVELVYGLLCESATSASEGEPHDSHMVDAVEEEEFVATFEESHETNLVDADLDIAFDLSTLNQPPDRQQPDESSDLNTFGSTSLDETDLGLLNTGDDAGVETSETRENSLSSDLDEAAQELVDLLSAEVAMLAESLKEALADTDSEAWSQALEVQAEDLERLGEGAGAVGLTGLQQATECLRSNLLSLVMQDHGISDAQRTVVGGWPEPVMGYLQGLNDVSARDALLLYLRDEAWPQPLSSEDCSALAELLARVELETGEDEQEPRQQHAKLEDIALVLPEDVNAELLDSLLQELPGQAAEFSASIQRLAKEDGSPGDIDAAQRIAHTLKGAANTVGIPGIANLTHHLEDILLALAKYQALPTPALSDTLVKAADSLEAISETLVGMGEMLPSEEMLGVLQEVLDWANLIDAEGAPQDETRPQTRDVLPGLAGVSTPQAEEEVQPQTAAAAVSTTRMSSDVVDELLRLAGESMILNGQLNDRLTRTSEQMGLVRSQNNVLQQLVLELEQLVDIRGIASPLRYGATGGEFDPLEMEQYNELHTVSRRLLEAVTDVRDMSQGMETSLGTLNDLLTDQRKIQQENESTIMRTRMVPVKTIAQRLQRGVRQACRLTGKDVELVIVGEETPMDSDVLSSMIDPLMHMLRNAVDHGIESPDERELIGKSRTGCITLDFSREGNTVVVRCRDDGAGLDYAAIRHTALERGLIRDTQALSDEEVGRLILQPGFSTRSETTQVSGRGIGMDAVYVRVQELKGSLALSSEPSQGCLVELRLPVTLMSTHGLLVRAGKQLVALSDRGIEQILYPGVGELGQVGNKATYQIGDDVFEVTSLSDVLNLEPDERQHDRDGQPALLVREESGRSRVIFVQEVVDSLTLVVKNLGRYIPPIKGIIGATVLGNGSAVPVLDVPELLHRPVRGYAGPAISEATSPVSGKTAPVALVVDDSLSARRALAEFVRDLGFDVRMAGDGVEAVALIDHQTPDILLVDLEMPRMNGLELTAHVRGRAETAQTPVIMITSRSTEKHRQIAAQAGVNAYLIKPFTEDELAENIQQLTALQGVA